MYSSPGMRTGRPSAWLTIATQVPRTTIQGSEARANAAARTARAGWRGLTVRERRSDESDRGSSRQGATTMVTHHVEAAGQATRMIVTSPMASVDPLGSSEPRVTPMIVTACPAAARDAASRSTRESYVTAFWTYITMRTAALRRG